MLAIFKALGEYKAKSDCEVPVIAKLPEIIAAAEKGTKDAPLGELQHIYGLIRDLAVQVSNVRTHVKRLELKVGGELETWGGE